ncbi:MAG: hypothetical protein ACTH32_06705 [Microbacterium gubbeenense]|uniref:hypothetical protein n=1 Tax=Microbacterium gubbeenense TaxID=159896 RepID=UPI003F9DFC6D
MSKRVELSAAGRAFRWERRFLGWWAFAFFVAYVITLIWVDDPDATALPLMGLVTTTTGFSILSALKGSHEK